MSRDMLRKLEAAGIGLASATFEIVGLPPLRVAADGKVPFAGPNSTGASAV